MGSYVVRIKVLPTGPEVPSQQLLDSIKGKLDKDMVLRNSKEEPIAFGLYSLTLDIVTPEEEGMIDKVEQAVATAPSVAQSELLAASRMSSQLKKA
ncbi:MAG: elongation factor 1-beta [Thaumarchaeota archaeon]|nr:elongation factor 1-beta [Nitrososphaerota archaeon]